MTAMASTTTAQATGANSGATCAAIVNGVAMTIQLARDLTVASGDVLLVHLVDNTWYGCCRLYASAAAAVDEYEGPDPNVPVINGQTVVMPVTTGTYRDAAWKTSTTDTMQGATGGYGNATGAAFYGPKPATLTGVTVTGAAVRLRSLAPLAATTLRLVTETEQPSGAPTLTSTTAGPSLAHNEVVDYPVPTAWVQAMVDGTAGGLALFDGDGSPYSRYAGLGTDPAAWLLTIDWTR